MDRNALPAWIARSKFYALALTTVLLVAIVGVRNAPSAAAGAPVTLPDLKILVPTDLISIGVDPGSGNRQLRFTHITADVGTGPFEIDPTYNSNTGTSTFVQVIYKSPRPGVWVRDHTVRVAQTGNWHPPSDYQFPLTKFTLNRLNAGGSIGPVVATSPKTDYCITGDYRLSGVANTPDQTSPSQQNCSDPSKPLGWSVGWGDQYDQTDAGQPIDLAGVADGTYILHAVADPQHVLTESNVSNDVTDTKLEISGNTVSVISQTTPGASPPTVRLTRPRAGQHVSGEVILGAAASASAPATVASVQFLLDGQPLGRRVTGRPYAYRWTVGSTAPGNHLLSARVTDSQGNVATATPVSVVVGGHGQTGVKVRLLSWHAGVLTLVVTNMPKGSRLGVELKFVHSRPRMLTVTGGRLRLRTARPTVVVLRVLVGRRQVGKAITARLGNPPTVRITNPTPMETLSGTVPIVAGASDELTVSSVQFFVDGRRIGMPVTASPYVIHWRTTRWTSGKHRVSALATDPSGGTATATVVVMVQNPAPPMTCFVMQAHVNVHGHGAASTPALHTAMPGETLLAFVSADGPAGPGQQTATVTGAGLRWKLVKRANASSGDSEIWVAKARTILRGAQITARLANPAFDESLTVTAMEGAKGVGSAVGASGTTGAPRVDLTTSARTSLVFAVGNDWDHAVAREFPTGWVSLDQWLDAGKGDAFWSQYTNQPTGRARTVVAVRVAAPTTDQWNLAAVELLNSGD